MTLREVYERLQELDRGAIDCEDFSLIGLSNAYLFCAFAYYERDESLVNDHTFDKVCKFLFDNWDFLEASGVRNVGTLIQENNLKAGTCLGVVWPNVVREMTDEMIDWKRSVPMKATEEYDI